MDYLTQIKEALNELKEERMRTQLTLGELIASLKMMDANQEVSNLCEPHSYRGYYDELAFELHDGSKPAKVLLSECEQIVGKTFEGYKGGEYTMSKNTPIWMSYYGYTGKKIVDIGVSGSIYTEDDD